MQSRGRRSPKVPKFYVHYDNDGKLQLKKTHQYGYFTQIQMAMGLSNVEFCDFVVFTFKGMIIVRVPFEKNYFQEVVKKLNWFYKSYMLPNLR